MRHDQFTTYLRTAGLLLGAVLFIFMVYRSSQGASSELAVKGKPYMWLGQPLSQVGQSAAFTAGEITPVAVTVAGSAASPVSSEKAYVANTNPQSPTPTRDISVDAKVSPPHPRQITTETSDASASKSAASMQEHTQTSRD